MMQWLKDMFVPTAEAGAEAGRKFVAKKPSLDEVNRSWAAASYLNDDYDRAWKAEVRDYRASL